MKIRLPEFNNVAAGQFATLDVLSATRGYVIDRIILKLTNVTKAQLEEITLKANLATTWQSRGDIADKFMQFRKISPNAAFLVIDFTESKAKEMMQQYMGSIDTLLSGIKTLVLEVKLATGLTNPRIEGWAEVSARPTQLADTVDRMAKTFYTPQNVNNSSTRFPVDIPFEVGSDALIKRIHFIPTAGITINSCDIRKNNVPIFESPADVNNYNLTEFDKVPQAGWFTVDFIMDDNFYGKALTLTDFDASGKIVPASMQYFLDVTVNTAGTITTQVEYIDTLNNR